jgi:S-formylglutathione hydrolase FrmB
MKKMFGVLAVLLLSIHASSAIVDTISIYSKSMQKDIKCVVISPAKADKLTPVPVVYLLHGYDGWYSNWVIRVPELLGYADEFNIMIVCPDGHKSSWYFDSPVDSTMRYETFVAKEVPEYVDAHYNTIRRRDGRAIAGLSMGGHGALFISFRNAETFGACASMSGLMDLNDTRNKYELTKRIGDTLNYATNWINYSVITLIEKFPKDSLAITIDCGINDPFIPGNRALHEKMLRLKIQHEYIERPGTHGWAYWRNSIKYQLYFFKNYFYRK